MATIELKNLTFSYNKNTPSAVCALDHVSLTIDGAADGITPRGGRYALTSGGAFTGAAVSRDEASKPKWVKGVSVVDGEIVLTIKRKGFMLIVR